MLLYTNFRERLDEQFPSLASGARQTLAKTCYPHADLWTDSDLLRSRAEPWWICQVARTGDSHVNAGDMPDHIFMVDVPHDWLFPQTVAVIHRGGANKTGASLRAGKPTVICPFVGDQSFWGRRMATLDAGPCPLPLRKLTAQNLATLIKTAVTDEPIRQRALALGEILRTEDGVGHAVEIIQSYLID